MNRGVESMMKFTRLVVRVGRHTLDEGQRAEMRGVSGTLNVEFTGADGGGWHIEFDDGRAAVAPGLVDGARATVRLAPQDYLAMLAGDLSPSVARMTGKVRVSGDGGFGIIFGGIVGSILNAKNDKGLPGRVTRWAVRRALRRGGYAGKQSALAETRREPADSRSHSDSLRMATPIGAAEPRTGVDQQRTGKAE